VELYKEYTKYRHNAILEYDEKYFIEYILFSEVLFIKNFYVRPEYRLKFSVRDFFNNFKKEKAKDVKEIQVQVDLNSRGSSRALSCFLKCGLKPFKAQDDVISLVCEVSNGWCSKESRKGR